MRDVQVHVKFSWMTAEGRELRKMEPSVKWHDQE